jgi:hypothetical protein
MQALSINSETLNERYLGLPVYVGVAQMNVFAYLKERVWQHIQGWKEKLLSRAGKEVLITAVAQAIPVFAMGCFDITKEMCSQISSMIARFWWNNQDREKCMHWLSWETLVSPQSDWGLVSETSTLSTWPCWLNRGGESLSDHKIFNFGL